MNIFKELQRIAKVLKADGMGDNNDGIEYTTAKSPEHSFKYKNDTIRVYDKPEQVKRFTAVLSGKEWDVNGSSDKTLVRFDMKGKTAFATGKEDQQKLGKPVAFKSLPQQVQKAVLNQVSGKWE